MAALKNTKSISMMLNLSPELNALLGASAKKSGRAKTTEALFRLEDHLRLYESIATPGQRFPAEGNDKE
ncbi:TraY domain-containing protein [Pantoea endophytica]